MAEDGADRLIARAIESVLDQVPGTVDSTLPEASVKLQPWAETAAPAGRNKRPLEELLEELTARVAADPGARANVPRTRRPSAAFFDRFGRGGTPESGTADGGSGRRRRRRRGGAGRGGEAAATAAPAGEATEAGPRPGRRRSRRGRGAAPPAAPAAEAPAQPRSAGRRRRGRRGRRGAPTE